MPTCAYMLDVMVGDLCLTDPPAIVDRTKDPLCPVVALQVHSGPLLYIPFLSPESIQSHLHDIGNGHDFLPLEVEESYLNGGKFVFRRGRSCLFTTFQRSSREADKEDDDPTDVGHYISIMVVNGLRFPPAMFGRCKATLPPCGIENGEPKRNLTGKVILHDHFKKSVASLQVSISLRSLGEDIALHANHFDNVSKEEKKPIPGSLITQNLKADLTSDDSRKKRLDKTINLLQEREINKHLYSSHEYNTVNRQPYINEHYRTASKTAGSAYVPHPVPKSSELLSMRIAEFERNLQDKLLEGQNTTALSSQLERNQQSPVLSTKKGSEMEILWSDKMTEVEGYALDFDESFSLSERSKSKSKSDSKEEKIEERRIEYKEVQLKKLKNRNKQKKSKTTLRDVAVSTHSPKKMRKTDSIKRPTGWLRSTPLTPYRIHNVPPHPKLTRTSLLRRAKMDPELAKQLHAEVDFQVKQKLKVLDQAFKEEMSILHRKRLMRSARRKMAVSSQTENEKDEDDLLLDIKTGSLFEDFSQQTDLFHQKSHKYTQIEGSFIKDTNETAQGKYTEDKQRPQRPTTAAKGRAGIRRGETYDIDAPDMGNTFTLGESNTRPLKSPQSETFYASTRAKKSEKVSSSPKGHRDGQQSDYSQSITDSEPKQRHRGSHSTNRTRDSKIKPSGSTYTIVARANESQSDEMSVEEKLIGSLSDKGSLPSRPDITDTHSRRTSSIHTVNSVGSTDSEASEVSEASDLSIEVYQEILKGKKADLLMSNGSKSSRLQEALSESSAAEEVLTAGDDSAGEESRKSNRKSNILQQMNKARRKGLINSRTYSIKEGQGLDASYNIPVIHGSSSSENDAIVKGGKNDTRYPGIGNGRDSVEGRLRELSSTRIRSTKTTPSPRFHKSEDEVEEGTVSDISARIAALLLPKKVQVTSMHTDSISSYIPSDVEGTLSSLSDMS